MEDLISDNSEQNKSGGEVLDELEKTGDYVFHGTYQKIDEFEPRQAKTIDESGQEVDDGPPAVFASTLKDPAIFRALINNHIDPTPGHWSGWDNLVDTLKFRAVRSGIDKANEKGVVGYVHVFNKNNFHPLRGFEVSSQEKVKPIKIIEVRGTDLPENIEIIEPYTSGSK